VISHPPTRPSWTCATCGDPWPCGPRRAELLAEYATAPAALGVLMYGYFCDAMQDLPRWNEHGVYRRFLGWLRDGPPTGR
jgi:hypothetical protein